MTLKLRHRKKDNLLCGGKFVVQRLITMRKRKRDRERNRRLRDREKGRDLRDRDEREVQLIMTISVCHLLIIWQLVFVVC
jgi:hypothetical protein